MVNGRVRGRLVAILHEQERHAAEVVTVEMREQDGVERAQVVRPALGRLQDAGAAVEQERRSSGTSTRYAL